MSSESVANGPPVDDKDNPRPPEWGPTWYAHRQLGPVTTYTYLVDERPADFTFKHDARKWVFVVTNRDGTTERFRDNPARHLVVEPDPETGVRGWRSNTAGPCTSTCAENRGSHDEGGQVAAPSIAGGCDGLKSLVRKWTPKGRRWRAGWRK